jgi:hypothetical protein
MKIVINTCHGGFGLSKEAKDLYKQVKNTKVDYFHSGDIERNDPLLVEIVEKLGENANGKYAKLKVVTIPDDVKWQIEEYDGLEWVAERHRMWT